MTPLADEKCLRDLEWSRIVDAVWARRTGPIPDGDSLPLAQTASESNVLLEETREAMSVLAAGEHIPIDGSQHVRPLLDRVERGGALTGAELRDIRKTLDAARALRRFVGQRKAALPNLHRSGMSDPSLDVLRDEIAASIDPDGTISDRASPEIRRLRTESANLRSRVVAKLEELIHKKRDLLSDGYHTIRQGRYVIPLRRDAHERIEGIVHATSASGGTVFVEPRALIAAGNRLKMAQAELEAEELRITQALTAAIEERLPELRDMVCAVEHVDVRQACARLGIDLEANVLDLSETPDLQLRRARHPILVLDGDDVVPADLTLSAGHGLVISGPNAGGKTVALKTMGLVALMMRAGLPVPADEGSACGFFEHVLTDVGDEQSLSHSLSTFSAQITNINSILEVASRGTLVLLDELISGTDPHEGAALACAIVDALCSRGAAVAVTTHYEPLKIAAASDPRLENAAVGFDFEQMAPTFEFVMGIPGVSSAHRIAQRFGMSEHIVQAAAARVPRETRAVDAMIAALEEQRKRWEASEQANRQALASLEQERAEVERLRAEGQARFAREVRKEEESLRDVLRAARRELEDARKKLRRDVSENAAHALREQIERSAERRNQAEQALSTDESPSRKPLSAPPEIGSWVWVSRLRSRAQVLAIDSDDRVRVAAGAMKLWVGAGELQSTEPPASGREPTSPKVASPRATRSVEQPICDDNRLDVRGLSVDDAVAMATSFLDRLYGASVTTGYIVHGVGSGSLRSALHAHLKREAHYVAGFRSGTLEEGGERLTVVSLK